MKSRKGDLHPQVAALIGEGRTQAQAARALGISPSTVSRILADHRVDDGNGPTREAVDVFVRSLGPELTAETRARVEALRVLAAKLDWARTATSATAAMAAPGCAKEFRQLLDELKASTSFDELREALLAAGD